MENNEVRKIFESYPNIFRQKLLFLRKLIFEVVAENKGMVCQETVKWGEPSYIVKKGSTIRIAWKSNTPDQYAMYFNCNTNLIETFRTIYGAQFNFEGNRAIIFNKDDEIPELELKHCIFAAISYHSRKHKPFLGL